MTLQQQKHGMCKTRFYNIWVAMKGRCYKKSYQGKQNYKDKGIVVCERWKLFKNFFEDMYETYNIHTLKFGEKQTTLDRIDNNKNYEPQNCKWSTWSQQAKNRGQNGIVTCLLRDIESGKIKTIEEVTDYIKNKMSS